MVSPSGIGLNSFTCNTLVPEPAPTEKRTFILISDIKYLFYGGNGGAREGCLNSVPQHPHLHFELPNKRRCHSRLYNPSTLLF